MGGREVAEEREGYQTRDGDGEGQLSSLRITTREFLTAKSKHASGERRTEREPGRR